MKDFYRALHNTAEQAGLKVLSDDLCCQLLAWAYVLGGYTEQSTHNVKLNTDIHVAAKRLNIAGGNRVEPALLPKLRQFIRDLEEYLRGEPKPKWLEVLENKYSLKPYKSITTNH